MEALRWFCLNYNSDNDQKNLTLNPLIKTRVSEENLRVSFHNALSSWFYFMISDKILLLFFCVKVYFSKTSM